MKLADKLIELRKEKGWSQEEFAEKLDVSRQAVSRWENETALPDAQNILRISKIFNVTTDYLLNEDNEGRADALAAETAESKIELAGPLTRKKKYPYWYLILVICLVILAACVIIKISKPTNEEHYHTALSSVKENEVASTCKAGGSYDEVVYCTTCNHAVVRTRSETEKLAHQYKDGQCMLCEQPQPSEGLMYMSNGDGTCFVSIGECTDEDIVIPEYSPSGEKVAQIKAYAFAGNTKVKSIRIPETVTAIGKGAFEDCTELESVQLPSKIKIIDSYTFNGCKKLKEITIPAGVYYIGGEAFADCISVESIVIPARATLPSLHPQNNYCTL